MIRQLVIISIALICISFVPKIKADGDLSSIYPTSYSDCVFPFTYQGKTYTNCTTDGNNGDIPWCSLTSNYIGVFTYCYNFFNTTLSCSASYSVNGKEYSGCNLLSKSAKYKQCKTNNPDYPTIYCPDVLKDASKQYRKRRRECEKKYKDLSQDHTMCFTPSPFAIQVNITDQEKQDLLDMHNQYRSAVPSAYMFKLYWDDELAKMAQARGDMCAFDHDLASNRLSPIYAWKNGQNMVFSDEIRNPLSALIDMMLGAEKETFFYGQGCIPDGTCLHYTQAMISNLTRVGCAHTQCVFPDRIERYLTCNYIESQYTSNYMTPYVQSTTPASACPNKATIDGLCDCGNKICNYTMGESLDPNTCTCVTGRSKRSIVASPSGAALSLSKRSIVASPSGAALSLSKRSIVAAPRGDKSMLQKRSIQPLKKNRGFKKYNN